MIFQAQKDKCNFMSNTWAWQRTTLSMIDCMTFKSHSTSFASITYLQIIMADYLPAS